MKAKRTLRVAIGSASFATYDREPLRLLEAAGAEIRLNPYGRRPSEAELALLLRDTDGLVAGMEPLTRDVLASAPRLRAIARVGTGLDTVDLEAAEARGIAVSNTPVAPAAAVAEATLAAMLCLCRRVVQANATMHAGAWTKALGTDLHGAVVLIVGYGRIGRTVARLVTAFGARVLACDPHVPAPSLGRAERRVTLEQGLAEADVVTLHCPGGTTLIGPAELSRMKPGAFLLNSARGELVDEAALIAALNAGRLAGAWIDVFVEEPYTGPLCNCDRVLLSPHNATFTSACRRGMELEAVRNLLRDLGPADADGRGLETAA